MTTLVSPPRVSGGELAFSDVHTGVSVLVGVLGVQLTSLDHIMADSDVIVCVAHPF